MIKRMSIVVLFLLTIVVPVFAASTPPGIRGSLHDWSSESWTHNQICTPCHTPHHAMAGVADAPLWNHELSTVVYDTYSSPTLNASVGQPSGISKLCLSCHDGTVAVEGTGGTMFVTGGSKIIDLRLTHPISFVYDTSLAIGDGGLHDPSTATTPLGGTIDNDMLFNGRMECSSCHDVHNKYGNWAMVKVTGGGSALCMTCHDK